MKNAVEQLARYEAHHRNRLNKATHFIGIPLIILSILIVMGWTGLRYGEAHVSLAWLLTLAALGYYFRLEAGLAVGMALVLVPMALLAQHIANRPLSTGAPVTAACFVGGWLFQFIGHGVFEKRRPAFMDDFFQLIVGPIFLMSEVYYALGWKRTLKREVKMADAAAQTRAYRV
jgi:uncharacterized membrane protein YGL010W